MPAGASSLVNSICRSLPIWFLNRPIRGPPNNLGETQTGQPLSIGACFPAKGQRDVGFSLNFSGASRDLGAHGFSPREQVEEPSLVGGSVSTPKFTG